jgi:hypothetical protein
MLAESKAEKWEDKVTFITPLFQQSKEQQAENNGKGRTQKNEDDLSESGSETRENGENIDSKGGKI